MSLATIPRYDPDRLEPDRGHAVVIGASMAGLFAARVLRDAYGQVTVLEKDALHASQGSRPGTPQAEHPHLLLGAGQRTIEDFFPGFGEDLLTAGGLVIDWASDLSFYDEGGYIADGPERIPMFAASRPLFDAIVHQQIAAAEGIRLREHCQFVDYRLSADGEAVEGISFRGNGTQSSLEADLVIDATGRSSRTPSLLADQGYQAPEVDEVEVELMYSTVEVERPERDRRMLFIPPSPPRRFGAGAFPVEDGRWLVTIAGVHGFDTPAEKASFADVAAELPVPAVQQLLEEHAIAGDGVHQYPFPASVWRHYEALDRFPRNLLVTGDAVASFNPVYGQGMSIAALDALHLHHVLGNRERESWAPAFFERVSTQIRLPWLFSVGSDFRFPETTGPKPRLTDLSNWYLSRLLKSAHTDGQLADEFGRVIMMLEPPRTLLTPKTLWRVLSPIA